MQTDLMTTEQGNYIRHLRKLYAKKDLDDYRLYAMIGNKDNLRHETMFDIERYFDYITKPEKYNLLANHAYKYKGLYLACIKTDGTPIYCFMTNNDSPFLVTDYTIMKSNHTFNHILELLDIKSTQVHKESMNQVYVKKRPVTPIDDYVTFNEVKTSLDDVREQMTNIATKNNRATKNLKKQIKRRKGVN